MTKQANEEAERLFAAKQNEVCNPPAEKPLQPLLPLTVRQVLRRLL
jgi:hypothetical protein